MSKTDRIVIGAATVIGASAVVMYTVGKKCTDLAADIVSNLMNTRFTLSQTREELSKSNDKISDANRILRNLISEDVKSENESRGKNAKS